MLFEEFGLRYLGLLFIWIKQRGIARVRIILWFLTHFGAHGSEWVGLSTDSRTLNQAHRPMFPTEFFLRLGTYAARIVTGAITLNLGTRYKYCHLDHALLGALPHYLLDFRKLRQDVAWKQSSAHIITVHQAVHFLVLHILHADEPAVPDAALQDLGVLNLVYVGLENFNMILLVLYHSHGCTWCLIIILDIGGLLILIHTIPARFLFLLVLLFLKYWWKIEHGLGSGCRGFRLARDGRTLLLHLFLPESESKLEGPIIGLLDLFLIIIGLHSLQNWSIFKNT